MDQHNKTDQFFREKLDQVEFTPTPQAWDQIQGQIKPAKRSRTLLFVRVAASIAVLLSLTFLYFQLSTASEDILIGQVDHPQLLDAPSLDIPVAASLKKETNIYPIVRKSAAQPAKTPETEKTIRPTIQLAAIEKVHLSTTLEASGELKNNPVEEKPAVKITYIASDQNSVDIEKDTVKFNLFNKVWSIAQNTSPIEIISDLRDAKDGLFESGFKRN